VSIWISDLLRLVALALAVFFLCKSARDLGKSDEKLSSEFLSRPLLCGRDEQRRTKRCAEAASSQAAKGKPAKRGKMRTIGHFFLPWNYETSAKRPSTGRSASRRSASGEVTWRWERRSCASGVR